MPTVPQYNIGQVQSTGVNGTQSISAPADAFGGNVARAQVGFGQQMAKQADVWHEHEMQMQEIYEKGVLRELDNNYTTHITEALHDPENGFLSLSGRNALDAKDSTFESITEYRKSLEKDLNPRMLRNWNAMADVRTKNAQGSIYKHSSQELVNYNKVERLARIDNYKIDAINNKGDLPSLIRNIKVGLDELEEQIQEVYGIDSENPRDEDEQDIVDNEKLKYTSAIHDSIIDAFIKEGSPEKALGHFEMFESAMLPNVRAKNGKLVSDETLKERAQTKTDAIMKMSGLTELEQEAEALKIKDSNLRDEVFRRVKIRQTSVANDLTRIEKEAKDKVDLLLSEGKTKDDIDPKLWDAMSDADEAKANSTIATTNKLLREAAQKRETEISKMASEAMYFQLDKIAHENFELFKTVPLISFTGLIDKSDLDKLIEKQRKGPHSSNTLSDTDLIKTAMASVGLEWKNLIKPDGEKERNFHNKYEQRVDRFAKLNNRDPNPDEKQNLLFEVANNMVFVASYSSDEQFVLGTLTSEQEEFAYSMVNGEQIFHSKIKATDRALIIKTLQELKQPINAQRIAEEFVSLRDKEIDAGEMTREEFLNEHGDTDGNVTVWQANNTSIKIKERELEQIQTKSNSLSHSIKIITDTSDMSNAEAIKAIKSHTGNILNKINWQNNPKATRKAKRQNLVGVITPLMQKELDTINEYLASINTESTHKWDLIFGTNVNLSLIASEGGEDGESMTDQYQDFQVESLRKRKQELEGLLQ